MTLHHLHISRCSANPSRGCSCTSGPFKSFWSKLAPTNCAAKTESSTRRLIPICRRASLTGHAAAVPEFPSRDTTERDGDVEQDIMSWASQAGIQSPKLTITDFAGLRGMAATSSIEPGEVLVSIPVEAALVVSPKERCQLPSGFCDAAFYQRKPWYVQMALKLMYERQLGRESKLTPYVMALPGDFGTPLTWTDAQLLALCYPHLQQEIEVQRRALKRLLEELKEATPTTPITEQDLIWALQAVRSRAFSGPYAGPTWRSRAKTIAALGVLAAASITIVHLPLEQVLNGAIAAALFNLLYDVLLSQKVKWYAMCPVIDFLNHKSSVKSEVEYEYFADRFSVRCQHVFQKGEQVFISYGPQGNDSLLQFYGFVEAGNPHDAHTVPGLRQAAAAAGCGLPAASLQALPADAKAVLTRTGPNAATQEMLAAAKLSAEQIRKVVRGLCSKELQRLGAEVAADTDLARAFRRERQRLLQACLAACS